MTIREITCKTALVKSGLPGFEYALNPYRGCTHACVYCYAPSILKYKGEEKWGDFVEVKRNMPRVLAREIRGGRRRGVIGIGTVTDPYQPAEEKYEVTRNCLEVLLNKGFPVNIQTKSTLVLRDIDLLKKLPHCEVGFTITSVDDDVRERYEPGSSPYEEKLRAIRVLSECGIGTWVFLGPIMPHITGKEDDLERLVSDIASYVDFIIVDKLRLKRGVWDDIESFLEGYDPDLIPVYRNILNNETGYFEDVSSKIRSLCRKNNIKHEALF
ncbi:MAG: radical SAM protein [Halobacteriota archaeon]|nr:radical SAM protein [Halobacteriota archaeon]